MSLLPVCPFCGASFSGPHKCPEAVAHLELASRLVDDLELAGVTARRTLRRFVFAQHGEGILDINILVEQLGAAQRALGKLDARTPPEAPVDVLAHRQQRAARAARWARENDVAGNCMRAAVSEDLRSRLAVLERNTAGLDAQIRWRDERIAELDTALEGVTEVVDVGSMAHNIARAVLDGKPIPKPEAEHVSRIRTTVAARRQEEHADNCPACPPIPKLALVGAETPAPLSSAIAAAVSSSIARERASLRASLEPPRVPSPLDVKIDDGPALDANGGYQWEGKPLEKPVAPAAARQPPARLPQEFQFIEEDAELGNMKPADAWTELVARLEKLGDDEVIVRCGAGHSWTAKRVTRELAGGRSTELSPVECTVAACYSPGAVLTMSKGSIKTVRAIAALPDGHRLGRCPLGHEWDCDAELDPRTGDDFTPAPPVSLRGEDGRPLCTVCMAPAELAFVGAPFLVADAEPVT